MSHCHGTPSQDPAPTGDAPVVLVGNPNVGKSVIFGALTGRRVTVSNYPGTTIEISRGTLNANGHPRPVIDTPGVQSIVPFSDDERVTRDILLAQEDAVVVQVADAKNLRRGLLIALELAEAGRPFLIALNMVDEAGERGIDVNAARLADALGVPVVPTVATRGVGLAALAGQLDSARPAQRAVTYPPPIEAAIARLTPRLPRAPLSQRALALMLLAGDDDLATRLSLPANEQDALRALRRETEGALGHPLAYAINRQRLSTTGDILQQVARHRPAHPPLTERLGRWMTHPLAGWPILAGVLYLMYLFVGVFGAGTLVDLLETRLFGELVNPWLTQVVKAILPISLLQDFLVGEYGLVTMALTYGLAIVLPIVGAFFLAFSVLEDSGYLPRLAVMLNRVFGWMGLNGKAVLPMILGLGCTTMATMSTRILESRKERLQVTLLLALGVPCSAQLGVVLGMVTGLGAVATLLWLGIVAATLLLVGYLAARVLPGRPTDFVLELPPIRVPALRNLALKTITRLEWYMKEVIPLFIWGTASLFALDRLGLLARLERLLSPVIVGWLNLPADATGAFLVGFLRRDYGAVALFDMARSAALTPPQVLVSLVVITLFMPCIATLLMIIKEYGARVAVGVAAFVFPFAIAVGGVLNWVLQQVNLF